MTNRSLTVTPFPSVLQLAALSFSGPPDTNLIPSRSGGSAEMRLVPIRGAKPGRVGLAGGMPFGPYRALASKFGDIKDMNRAYFRLRLVKSAEELDWFRIGARLALAGEQGRRRQTLQDRPVERNDR